MTGWALQWLIDQAAGQIDRRSGQPPDQAPSRPPRAGRPLRVVELCAGSGAISLALATEWAVGSAVSGGLIQGRDRALFQWAVENSVPALKWLRHNTVGQSIQVVAADMAAALPELDSQVDLVIANPPYIRQSDWQHLPPEVRQHDPRSALVAGHDGLDAIRLVAQVAHRLLRVGGVVLCEHDDGQFESAPAVFQGRGFAQVADHRDWTDRPRFVTARRQSNRGL
jgi:release factor glutamine methyltransferase